MTQTQNYNIVEFILADNIVVDEFLTNDIIELCYRYDGELLTRNCMFADKLHVRVPETTQTPLTTKLNQKLKIG